MREKKSNLGEKDDDLCQRQGEVRKGVNESQGGQ